MIELLVVIAIIAILAAILFPVFAQAKEAAKSTTCLSNTKQIALSQLLYTNDYDDNVIPSNTAKSTDPIAAQVAGSWTQLILPYTKSSGLLFCPSFSESNLGKAMDDAACDGNGTAGSGSTGVIPPQGGKYLSHYGIAKQAIYYDCPSSTETTPYANYPGTGWDWTDSNWQTTNLSSVVESARTANIGDAFTAISNDGSSVITKFGCEAQYRHKGSGGNFSFLDGHSKYLKGNPERIHSKDASGCVYETYFTLDK